MRELDPDVAQVQLSWGLPAEPLVDRRLFYNAVSNAIVLACTVVRERIGYGRLFTRRLSDKQYRAELGGLGEDHSLTCPLVCHAPILFFLVEKWVRKGEEVFGLCLGVARLNLLTGQHELWNTDVPGPERCFVAELSGVGKSEETELYAVAGFRAEGGIGRVEYQMIRLDWERRVIDRLAPLDSIFF